MRQLDLPTLEAAAPYYASQFVLPQRRDWVMGQFYGFTFKDEFDALVELVKQHLAAGEVAEFERLAGDRFAPRDEAVFHRLLADKLAIDPDGGHIPGKIGTTELHGRRPVGTRAVEVETRDSITWRKRHGLPKSQRRETEIRVVLDTWPIYAGEQEERTAGSGVADRLPEGAPGLAVGAEVTTIANVAAIAGIDAIVDLLDGGTGAAVVQGRTGAGPGPDNAATGTLLGTLVCSDPAFGAGADANPGGRATASAITPDSSADATGTLGHCRGSSSNDGVTPLVSLIEGNCLTADAAFVWNTVAIVAGAQLEISSWTVTQPEG